MPTVRVTCIRCEHTFDKEIEQYLLTPSEFDNVQEHMGWAEGKGNQYEYVSVSCPKPTCRQLMTCFLYVKSSYVLEMKYKFHHFKEVISFI